MIKKKIMCILLMLILTLASMPTEAFAADPVTPDDGLGHMTAYVNVISNLSYKGDNTPLKLVEDGCTAKDSMTFEPIEGATVEYAVKTRAETESGGFDESALEYSTASPTVTAADEYILFYRVSKPGYETFSSSEDVTVERASVTLNWEAAELDIVTSNTTDGNGDPVTANFIGRYSAGSTYAAPVAVYTDLTTNTAAYAAVTGTGNLDRTGTYTFTAAINDNYLITNPNVTVLIDGGRIEGYTLANSDEGSEVWFDGDQHAVAKLNTADNATGNVDIEYSLDGENWAKEIPKVTGVGNYTCRMKLAAPGYYDLIQSVNFDIKGVDCRIKKYDWVIGWDAVLVFTDSDVPGFQYNGKNLYDLSGMKNKYQLDTKTYTHVYGLIMKGNADITKVVPSNEAAIIIDYDDEAEGIQTTQHSQYDVNSSGDTNIYDLVAVQAIYNADSLYINDDQMSIVLRADVNRDMKVDTMDCSMIKLNTPNN